MQSIQFYESLFILHKCSLNLERLKNLMTFIDNSNETNKEDYILLSIFYINLEACSFLEEFRKGFQSDVLKNRIMEFRKITLPILKRINKWEDLEKFRSSIVAHPWRDKRKQFIVPNVGCFKVPRNRFEIYVLLNLMKYLWDLLEAEFGNEIIEAISYVSRLQNREGALNDYRNINIDHIEMVNEVNENCKLYERDYFLKIFLYEFDDIQE